MAPLSSNVLVRRRDASARWSHAIRAAVVLAVLAVAACEASSGDGDSGGGDGGTSGTGGNAGSLVTGGSSQGGVAGTTPTGGGGQGGTSGAAPSGGASGAAPSGGTSGAAPSGGAAGQSGAASGGMSGAGGSVISGGASGGAGAGGLGGGAGASGGAGSGAGGASGGGGAAGQSGRGGSGAGGTAGSGGRPTHTGALKIMPLGDSITQASCYRARLWQKLQQAGKTNFDFVGTQTSSGCGISGYDPQHEGHGGYLVTNLTGSMLGELRTWITTNTPDLVLFHFGTNDAWNNIAPQTILSSFGTVVDELRARNPNVWVLVAQIIPMNPVNTASCMTCACTACGGRVQTLNSMIPSWAASKSTAASPVLVVDQWTGYDANADSNGDGVHPSETGGSEKMATRWFNAVSPLF
jgi:lysophospholipase L1-like esterase